MGLINKTIKPGMTCIDIGANIGYATMFMLRNSGSNGIVYAIEPDEHNLKLLKKNIAINKFECETIKALISNINGESDFWIAKHPNLNSVDKTKYSIRKEKIDCYTLGEFCSTRNYPNFIKMDIEGHEVKVFEGGLDYFNKNRGETHILIEVHPEYYNEENDFAKILKEYFKIGFNCSAVVSTPVPRPLLFKKHNYLPDEVVRTDGFKRGLYFNINNEDMLEFACKKNHEAGSKKIVRSIMISRN